MPTYSYYAEKRLVYIIIIAPFSRQLSSYAKYIKLNMRLFYNIYLIFNAKYTFLTHFYTY